MILCTISQRMRVTTSSSYSRAIDCMLIVKKIQEMACGCRRHLTSATKGGSARRHFTLSRRNKSLPRRLQGRQGQLWGDGQSIQDDSTPLDNITACLNYPGRPFSVRCQVQSILTSSSTFLTVPVSRRTPRVVRMPGCLPRIRSTSGKGMIRRV